MALKLGLLATFSCQFQLSNPSHGKVMVSPIHPPQGWPFLQGPPPQLCLPPYFSCTRAATSSPSWFGASYSVFQLASSSSGPSLQFLSALPSTGTQAPPDETQPTTLLHGLNRVETLSPRLSAVVLQLGCTHTPIRPLTTGTLGHRLHPQDLSTRSTKDPGRPQPRHIPIPVPGLNPCLNLSLL